MTVFRALMVVLCCSNSAFAMVETKLVAPDAAAESRFGESVAVDGDTIVVGAMKADNFTGAAYVFTRDAAGVWSEQAKLTAPDATEGDAFGSAVSLDAGTLVVGAPEDYLLVGSGSAYVFVRNGDGTWSEQTKLTASDGEWGDLFGSSVSIDGDFVVIGAAFEDTKGADAGAAYVFKRNSEDVWSEEAKLTASDGAAGDEFGWAVSLSGDTVAVGADGDDDYTGAAYVFKRVLGGFWIEQPKLTAGDGVAGDLFGRSVSLDRGTLIVGASFRNAYAGAAYVFNRDADGIWTETATLTASDGAANDSFGESVACDNGTAVIGAFGVDGYTGAAYIFTFGTGDPWGEVAKAVPTGAGSPGVFGFSVAIGGNTVACGEPQDTQAGTNSGSAYAIVGAPIGPVFADDFESGATGNWSVTTNSALSPHR